MTVTLTTVQETLGEMTADFPFGYGYCQCGCGKATRLIGNVYFKFFHRSHNPKVRKIALELARQRVKQAIAKLSNSSEPPPVKQPTAKAIAKEHLNERLSQTVAWTKVNQNFIKWNRTKLRARSNETAKRYIRERRERDPAFKLISYVRGRIGIALKSKGAKKGAKTEILVGCSIQELKKHLEVQFKKGMSWNNYGQWHVDHIKPCCCFDLTKIEEQMFS